ncbi:hypothetical protein V496_04359 [Pseudogymnoascus sp. VKM F-4515 (FW-2607)]|nr:hypothetical protein V496_04359 [Pseudogymnoascus sp. VKM F-4515 (FW-2607)]
MGDHVPSITVTDFTDTAHEGDADDEYFDSHEDGLSRTSSTFTQKVIIAGEVTAADGSGQASGQITEHVTEVVATKSTGDAAKQPASQRVKVSQTTGTITGKLPNSKDAKQVKISGQVTEVTATQGPTDPPTNQTPVPGTGPGTGTSTPRRYWAEREVIPRPAKTIRPPKWVRRSLQNSAGSTQGSPLASAPRSLNPSEVWARHPGDVDYELEEMMAGDGPQGRRASTPPGRTSPDKGTSTPKSLLQKLQQISHSRKASASGPPTRKGKGPEEPRPEEPPIYLEHQTTNTLRGTSQFFAKFLSTKRRNERAMHPMSPDEQSLKLPRKRFGLAPWHQNPSGDTVRTTTSSIRELLFGRTPTSTPQPGATLVETKPDEYFGVEVPGTRSDDDESLPRQV